MPKNTPPVKTHEQIALKAQIMTQIALHSTDEDFTLTDALGSPHTDYLHRWSLSAELIIAEASR